MTTRLSVDEKQRIIQARVVKGRRERLVAIERIRSGMPNLINPRLITREERIAKRDAGKGELTLLG